MTQLAAATGDAVAVIRDIPDRPEISLTLEGSGAQCVAVDPSDPHRILAGTFDNGVFLSRDGGQSWTDVTRSIPHKRVLSVAVSPCDREGGKLVLYAGTEPSALFRSDDDGGTWTELTTLQALPSKSSWSFPPRPWTHHVRWIAPHHTKPEVLFVGIELGGVLRTLDAGDTWEDRHPDTVIDPHVLRTHPVATDRVYGVGGDGVAYSLDTGASWRRDVDGMDRYYTWGSAIDPEDPDLWYISASTGPMEAHGDGDAEARLYRRWKRNAWEPIPLDGLDGVSAPLQRMPYALVTPGPARLIAGMHDGEIFYGEDAGETWRCIDVRLPGLSALAV